MNYQFDLKGSQLFLLLGGMVLVGALVFLVGMLVGAGSAPEVQTTQTEGGDSAAAESPVTDHPAAAGPAESSSTAPPISQPTAAAGGRRIYELQLSAHLDEEATRPVMEDLSASNLQPYVVESKDSRDRTLFTVRLGPWDSMAEAARAARTFREQTSLDAYDPVIRHRPKPMTVSPVVPGTG